MASERVIYGGFWRRAFAAFIDLILLSLANQFLRLMLASTGMEPTTLLTTFATVSTTTTWLYFALFQSSDLQATPGKMALNMTVTDTNGQQISFLRATGRHFSKFISGIILGIGFIMIAFTEKKQGLHDMIADTLVVKTS